MATIDPTELGRRELNGLINGLVYPRPIAWVSTCDAQRARNLAPFSFFNAFSFNPPTLGIGPGSRQGIDKDSLRNLKDTGEYVVNLVSEPLAELANLCSAEVPREIDEWDLSGVTPVTSTHVAPARVGEAPAAFECRVTKIVDLGDTDVPTNSLVIGRVLCIHVRDDALDGLTPIPERLRLVGRLGGDLWCRTRDTFELPRPPAAGIDELRMRAQEYRRR